MEAQIYATLLTNQWHGRMNESHMRKEKEWTWRSIRGATYALLFYKQINAPAFFPFSIFFLSDMEWNAMPNELADRLIDWLIRLCAIPFQMPCAMVPRLFWDGSALFTDGAIHTRIGASQIIRPPSAVSVHSNNTRSTPCSLHTEEICWPPIVVTHFGKSASRKIGIFQNQRMLPNAAKNRMRKETGENREEIFLRNNPRQIPRRMPIPFKSGRTLGCANANANAKIGPKT